MEEEKRDLSGYQKLCQLTAKKFDTPEQEILTWGLGITGKQEMLQVVLKKHLHRIMIKKQG